MRVVLATVLALAVPAGAFAATPNYRFAPTKACLTSKRVLITYAGPNPDFARFGVTGQIWFNFGLDPGEGDPPQGFLLFTRSPAAAKVARAGIVREIEKKAKLQLPPSFVSIKRNVLLIWLVKAQRLSQTRTIDGCLKP